MDHPVDDGALAPESQVIAVRQKEGDSIQSEWRAWERAQAAMSPAERQARDELMRGRLLGAQIDYETAMVKQAKTHASVTQQRLRTLGLGSDDPEHIDHYSIEAGLDPDVLRDVLASDKGARLGVMMAGQLRSCGELDRVRASWVMLDLLRIVEGSLKSGNTPSDNLTIKLIEAFGKRQARGGDNPAAVLARPPVFEGNAADLIAALTEPFKAPDFLEWLFQQNYSWWPRPAQK